MKMLVTSEAPLRRSSDASIPSIPIDLRYAIALT
jgi:hypothetical protein